MLLTGRVKGNFAKVYPHQGHFITMLITKIEAKEACDWLRAAGFPQYVQIFKDCRFPIDIEWAKSDHEFLDKDALESLCRRLSTLNKCAEMRLEPGRSKRRGDDSDDEDPCAVSNKWSYDRHTRRWQRLNTALYFLPSSEGPVGSQETPLCGSSDRNDVSSVHSTSSTESESHSGGLKIHRHPDVPTATTRTTDEQETSRSSSRCSSTNKTPSMDSSFSGPPSPYGSGDGSGIRELSATSSEAEHSFPGKPPRKKGSSLLRKMERLRLRGTSSPVSHSPGTSSLARLHISGPAFLEGASEGMLGVLQCPASLQGGRGSQASSSPSSPHPGSTNSSSSASESSSAVSTPSPVTRVRSNYRRITGGGTDNDAGTNRNSQNEEPPLLRGTEDYRNQINGTSHESLLFQVPHGHKPGTFPTTLTHKDPILSPITDNTINWRTGSFHGYRGRHSRRGPASSSAVRIPSPMDPRASIYDNVPIQQLLGTSGGSGSNMEQEGEEPEAGGLMGEADMFSALDSVMERISDLQQLVSSWSQDLLEDECRGETSSSSSSSASGASPAQASSSPSPCPSSPNHIHLEIQSPQETEEGAQSCDMDEEDTEVRSSQHGRRGSQQLQWWRKQSLAPVPSTTGLESQSVSNIHLLQKLSLLKLTALMDKYSPSSKQGWSWTVPKPLRKTRLSEVKGRKVFGLPLIHSCQQMGGSLPVSILRALTYLRMECLDQVGLFRKSGVKSRIQFLRDLVESDPDGVSFEGQSAFDVADMVKQYFRDLPEPIFSSKLSESFLHIYQYFPKDQQLVAVQAAILLLPDENREALRTLLFFLRDVVACVEENQMTPTNIAVCLAPSLFHLNTIKRDADATRSGHRKYSLGRPDQKDLSENLAATQGLAHMVSEAPRLFQLPDFWLGQGVSYTSDDCGDRGGRVPLSRGREEEDEQERKSRLELDTQSLLKEAREKSKGWEGHSAPDHVDLAFKRLEDGCPLRLWRGSVEVDAPQKDLLNRLLREPGLWEKTLCQAEVVQTLSKDTEVFRYLLQGQGHGLGYHPLQEHLLLRIWQSDPLRGPLRVSSVSIEQPDIPIEGVRAQVHSCLYLLEPLGSKKTRLTHLYRADTRGRSLEWHNRVSGHLLAFRLIAIRDSFRPDH